MKTQMEEPKNGWKTKFINLWNVAGALVSPNGITLYAKHPQGVIKVVLIWSSSAILI